MEHVNFDISGDFKKFLKAIARKDGGRSVSSLVRSLLAGGLNDAKTGEERDREINGWCRDLASVIDMSGTKLSVNLERKMLEELDSISEGIARDRAVVMRAILVKQTEYSR